VGRKEETDWVFRFVDKTKEKKISRAQNKTNNSFFSIDYRRDMAGA